MRNVKLTLKFIGTAYHGWQIQKNGLTIQECIQKAIYLTTSENVSAIGCGRTDSGVHANQYVCNFTTNSRIPSNKFPFALNSKLPKDIVCQSAFDVSDDFHSGKSAKSKEYVYRFYSSPIRNPFYNDYSWFTPYKLDVDKMNEAASFFIGTHDFSGFASAGYTVKTTVRTIYKAAVEQENDFVTFRIRGNGFLYNMVRIIAGTLYYVGTGMLSPTDIPHIISSCDRTKAGITAPPEGLYLWEVFY